MHSTSDVEQRKYKQPVAASHVDLLLIVTWNLEIVILDVAQLACQKIEAFYF